MPDAYRRAYSKGTTEKQQKNEEQEKQHNSDLRYIDRPAPDEILKLYSGGMNDGRIKKADTPVSGEA